VQLMGYMSTELVGSSARDMSSLSAGFCSTGSTEQGVSALHQCLEAEAEVTLTINRARNTLNFILLTIRN
jgi:hypothetical protein